MHFSGLIQHSFALRLAKEHRPFDGPGNLQRIQERFALPAGDGPAFEVRSLCEPGAHGGPTAAGAAARIAEHSPLVEHGQTTVQPLSIGFSGACGEAPKPELPPAFRWAERGRGEPPGKRNEPKLVFAEVDLETEEVECNDFLVERPGCDSAARSISWSLLELLAYKRSRLLGLALANRVVTVMLPHAILTSVDDDGAPVTSAECDKSWFAQPLVSFVRCGRVKSEFRDSYSLTLLLIPVTGPGYEERTMSHKEIYWTVNAGWGLAAAPVDARLPRFQARGPLLEYLPRLAAPCDPASLLRAPGAEPGPGAGGCGDSLTLRRATEVLAFGLGMRLAQGSLGRATERTRRQLGDDVVTSLGSARVSSVLVLDELSRKEVRGEKVGRAMKNHRHLMAALSRETRPPRRTTKHRKYRLDRPFVDDDTYVVGVVPTNRCLIVSSSTKAQHGWCESGLMQAGSLAHMTIGAATAIGTLRAIDRDLEGMEAEDPTKIAEIGGEIAADLREIYDLDITSEAYRHLYRLLRKRLGIASDYKTLQDKMAALHRSTATRHEVRSQLQIAWLTAAIVGLSVLILIFTVAVASK